MSYTEYAGLNFQGECEVQIDEDGLVEIMTSTGISAVDSQGKLWSDRITRDNRRVLVPADPISPDYARAMEKTSP